MFDNDKLLYLKLKYIPQAAMLC